MQLPLLLSRYGDGTKKAQFGTHVLSELSFGFLCVCNAIGVNRNYHNA